MKATVSEIVIPKELRKPIRERKLRQQHTTLQKLSQPKDSKS